MHLKSVTLKGFKSFAQPTTFAFETGVTCIVGPNGSGKSNVVDALAWVMGEQGAKSLRGGKMEDVIFAGTSTRGPLGRAEVSLTIDNSDGALPIEYSEVTISRTLFRSGTSEYAINGEQCRLLDVQELLSDSGLGREMHVIVGQGQLDQGTSRVSGRSLPALAPSMPSAARTTSSWTLASGTTSRSPTGWFSAAAGSSSSRRQSRGRSRLGTSRMSSAARSGCSSTAG